MSIIIVGAGVTGLTVAHCLQEKGQDVVVLEKEPVVGGLCRSYRYGDFTFDIGPHRLSSANKQVNSFFLSILNDSYSSIPRHSSVYMNNKYLSWPLSLESVFRLPFSSMMNCALDLLTLENRNESDLKNLEEYITAKYGPTIFKLFWEKYTEKFLGIPCREVDAEWVRLSVKHAIIDRKAVPHGLFDLARNCLLRKGVEMNFLYPRNGMGTFPDMMAASVTKRGGTILTSQAIESITVKPDSTIRVRAGNKDIEGSSLVWTGSLIDLCRIMEHRDPGLEYISTLLYNFELSKDPGGKWQWIYFPDPDCVFSRVSLPDRFGSETVPAGKGSLCVEVTCKEGDANWKQPETLIDRIKKDLLRVGLTSSAENMTNCHIERVRDTYPLYRNGFEPRVRETMSILRKNKNIHLVGRQAAFSYDNIDDAVHNAMIFAESL